MRDEGSKFVVVFGAIGLTLFGIDLFLARPEQAAAELVGVMAFLEAGHLRLIFDVVMVGFNLLNQSARELLFGLEELSTGEVTAERSVTRHRSFRRAASVAAAMVAVAIAALGGLLG